MSKNLVKTVMSNSEGWMSNLNQYFDSILGGAKLVKFGSLTFEVTNLG